ncbi:MAG: hypothetical protein KGL39_44285 [Patescibacteria group bacterium]|nr:hypothetical protein [Patescibacteria group bacterium]
MRPEERAEFLEVLSAVFTLYGKEFSETVGEIWCAAFQDYEFSAVKDALSRHAMNPDSGQFLPKPADVVKMIGGSTMDAALVAWSKLERAVKGVGAWRSVAFDDPLLHAVVNEMGGWIALCEVSLRDWPFKQNEFVARYRGYRSRNEAPAYPGHLPGRAEGPNAEIGYQEPVVLVGAEDAVLRVIAGGSEAPALGLSRALPRLPERRPKP